MKDIKDKFKGMFWGLVVGDCLGSPIQFTGKDDHEFITKMVPCEHFHTPAGAWTDDSSMAFCIAESYVRLKRYDLEDIANNFYRWLMNGFWSSKDYSFDVGEATKTAIYDIHFKRSLKNGTEDTQGNGSIMRLAPAFIMNYGAPDNVMLYEISDLTHCSQTVRDTVDLMASILTSHVKGMRTPQQSIYKSREEVNISGWAVSTLQAALWAFNATNDFESGMIQAVNLGGDADSIGAVFGQIAGAYYGFDAIPQSWVKKVKKSAKINELIEAMIDVKLEEMNQHE